MKYIIHGATGAQGSPLFKKGLQAGKAVVAAVRDPSALTDVPAVAVDYTSVDSLAAAYRDAKGVFVHLPVVSEEERLLYARNIAKAIGQAKPRRVVISTSGWVVDEPGTSRQSSEDSAVSTLIRGIEKTGVSLAVIAPRLYLENLLLPLVLEPVKHEGILRYPLGADFPVSWSSHLDIADVADALFADISVTGVVGVGQQPAVTGVELADAFSKHFGREVTYKGLDPDEFGELLTPLFGAGAAAGVVGGYKSMAQVSANAINSKSSAQTLLGITPRTVGQWLSEIGV